MSICHHSVFTAYRKKYIYTYTHIWGLWRKEQSLQARISNWYCGAQLPIHARSRDTRLRRQRPHLHTWVYILYILWLLLACLCILLLWFLYLPYGHDHKRLNKNARQVVAPCRFWLRRISYIGLFVDCGDKLIPAAALNSLSNGICNVSFPCVMTNTRYTCCFVFGPILHLGERLTNFIFK